MEGDILSKLGNIFLVKGNDVQTFSALPVIKFDPAETLYEGTTPHRIKKLLAEGYELAVDDGSEKGKEFRRIIQNSNVLGNSTFMNYYSHESMAPKLIKNIKLMGSGLGKILPSIVGFSTPIGAAASGLLWAGTSRPAGANTAIEPYEGVYATRNILDTPITPANRNLYDQAGVDTSLGPMDRDRGFDRYMQDKIQNQQNTQGIMNAKPRPIQNYTAPDRGDWGPGLHLYRGGIASLRR
jgi:hypothetical protein